MRCRDDHLTILLTDQGFVIKVMSGFTDHLHRFLTENLGQAEGVMRIQSAIYLELCEVMHRGKSANRRKKGAKR